MSIGDVLALLKAEFPDVTISKIRFLESQGLISPERTPSGYRKFYEADVARLRWILEQQREHFLPLKVIKDRLGEGTVPYDAPGSASGLGEATAPGGEEEPVLPPGHEGGGADPLSSSPGSASKPSIAAEPYGNDADADAYAGAGAGAEIRSAAASVGNVAAEENEHRREGGSGSLVAVLETAETEGAPAVAVAAGRESSAGPAVAEEGTAASRVFTRRELANASGLSDREVDSLEQYGLIRSHDREGSRYYDYKAKVVADIAARFAAYGLEARHLRTYRSSVDREVNLFGQAVSSQLRLRNPEAAAAAAVALDDLCALAAELRSALLKWELAELKGS